MSKKDYVQNCIEIAKKHNKCSNCGNELTTIINGEIVEHGTPEFLHKVQNSCYFYFVSGGQRRPPLHLLIYFRCKL